LKKLLTPSEHQLQVSLVEFWEAAGKKELHLFAIPNGELRNIQVALRLKREGGKPGTPDLCIILPEGKTAWLEMKTRGGRLSMDQKAFRDTALANGHYWACAYTLDQAVKFLTSVGAIRLGVKL
jgi:hypothetical protein